MRDQRTCLILEHVSFYHLKNETIIIILNARLQKIVRNEILLRLRITIHCENRTTESSLESMLPPVKC